MFFHAHGLGDEHHPLNVRASAIAGRALFGDVAIAYLTAPSRSW